MRKFKSGIPKEEVKRLKEEMGDDSPGGLRALVVEVIEWSFYALIVFIIISALKPVWKPIVDVVAKVFAIF